MIEITGLIQAEVAERLALDSKHENAAIWAVESYKPDYLVLQQGLFPNLEKGYTSRSCTPFQRFNGEQYQYLWDLEIHECEN